MAGGAQGVATSGSTCKPPWRAPSLLSASMALRAHPRAQSRVTNRHYAGFVLRSWHRFGNARLGPEWRVSPTFANVTSTWKRSFARYGWLRWDFAESDYLRYADQSLL